MDASASGIDQARFEAIVGWATQVEHEQILVGRRRRSGETRATHQFEMPRRLGPTHHEQNVFPDSLGVVAPQHLKTEAADPEPLGGLEVTTGTRKP